MKFILLVDHSVDNFLVIQGIVEDHEIDIEFVIDGKRVVDLCKIKRYDLIIMNEKMPEINVMQTALKVKDISVDIPIMLLSDMISDDADSTMITGVADCIIGLPLNFKKIQKQLNVYLNIKPVKRKFGVFGL